jgi:hypothetical protein
MVVPTLIARSIPTLTGAITVDLAAGMVSGAGVGTDTLISVESIRGSAFADIYVATGYTGVSRLAASRRMPMSLRDGG